MIGGASTLIIHFYIKLVAVLQLQFPLIIKMGGIFIVQPVMVMVLKPTGPIFTPPPENLQQEMLVHCRYLVSLRYCTGSSGTSSALGLNSIVLGDNDTGL